MMEMIKKIIEYNTLIDSLVALSKRLSLLEEKYHLSSEVFFNKFSGGKMEDTSEFIEWANDYRHFLAIRIDLAKDLKRVA
jgi:hypothetical protein